MKLTDKTLENFEGFLYQKYYLEGHNIILWFLKQYKTFQINAIVDFFDSVNIYINIKSKFGQRKQCERFSFSVKGQSSGFSYNSRQEATENAILTANKIYNENL